MNMVFMCRVYSLDNVGQRWIMELLLWGMVQKMVLITGLWRTHGANTGERMDMWRSRGIWTAPTLASVALPWSPLIPSRLAKILPTQALPLPLLISLMLSVMLTIPALRAPHAAACLSTATTALRGDAARLNRPPAVLTMTAAAPMTTPSAMSQEGLAGWWVKETIPFAHHIISSSSSSFSYTIS